MVGECFEERSLKALMPNLLRKLEFPTIPISFRFSSRLKSLNGIRDLFNDLPLTVGVFMRLTVEGKFVHFSAPDYKFLCKNCYTIFTALMS